jgi:hypothetical protein
MLNFSTLYTGIHCREYKYYANPENPVADIFSKKLML